MSTITSVDPATRSDPAVLAARQALHRAQARVDADHRAHSPACAAIDQRGVDRATTALTKAADAATSTLSILA